MIRNRIFENKFGGNLATQPDSKSFDLGQCHDLTRVSSLFGGRTNIEIARIAWGRRDELLHNEPHGREGRTTTTTTFASVTVIPQNQSSLQIGVPDQVSRKTDPLSTRGIFNLPRVHVSTSPLSNYTREDNAITRGVVVVVVVGANGSLYTHVHTYIACKKVAALTLSPPRPLSPRLESDHRR